MTPFKAPFPYFGGKRRVAAEVWCRFGADVANYVEPFCGSLAVLLERPGMPRTETVNDIDSFVANAWRAIRWQPEAVAEWCDWPVSEADLHARHYWLITQGRERLAGLLASPLAFDPQIAGWWIWGACSWIGSGWCAGDGPWELDDEGRWVKGQGIHRKLPAIGGSGHSGTSSCWTNRRGIHRQLPAIGGGGDGPRRHGRALNRLDIPDRAAWIRDWLVGLSLRLRDVRITCGDWRRVVTPAVTWRHGITGILLDPPYATGRTVGVYAHDSLDLAAEVRAWAIAAGERPDLRIALCAYDDGQPMPEGWSAHAWKARGGYGNQADGRGRENAKREIVWFSPACLPAEPAGFVGAADG